MYCKRFHHCSPATSEQHLAVDFDRRAAAKLPARQVGVVRAVDKVVTQRLVQLLVDLDAVQKYGRVLVRHQVAQETVQA